MADKTKMVAIKEFDGLEGFIKAGEEFEVKNRIRAEALKKAGLADYPKAKKAAEDKAAK
jgi:hypothetical protein